MHPPDCHLVGVKRGSGIYELYELKEFPGDSDLSQGWEPAWRLHILPDSWNEILISCNTQQRGDLAD